MAQAIETGLDAGRAAVEAHEWQRARDVLSPLVDGPDPSPAVLDVYADASWWLGQLDDCIAARERAFIAYDQHHQPVDSARMAMLLFDNLRFRGRPAAANGWLGRARQQLASVDECLEHGSLAVREGEMAHADGDLDAARERFTAAIEHGRRWSDADLEGDGLQAMGRALVAAGEAAKGLAHLDEAMLLAVEGRLGTFMTGKVYCSLITACEELGDVRRAAEWTEAGMGWADDLGDAVFPGLCRVHRAEVLQLRGDWHRAEAEARLACDELGEVHLGNAAFGFHEIGEIRRRVGDLDQAEAAFQRAEVLGGDAQPGRGLLLLDRHDVEAAAASIARALSGRADQPLSRAKLLPAAVEIFAAAGDVEAARASGDELASIAQRFGSNGLLAASWTARGRVHLASGDVDGACAALTRAVESWQELEVPYEAATARALLGRVCRLMGDEEGARAAFDAAAAAFGQLGAAPGVAAMRDLKAGVESTANPGGLTDRECEVLCLVASGITNKEIAAQLYLSEKTVARHLSNIYVKLDVSSRTAATAFAYEKGLVGG